MPILKEFFFSRKNVSTLATNLLTIGSPIWSRVNKYWNNIGSLAIFVFSQMAYSAENMENRAKIKQLKIQIRLLEGRKGVPAEVITRGSFIKTFGVHETSAEKSASYIGPRLPKLRPSAIWSYNVR
jgi:hypothetical protein